MPSRAIRSNCSCTWATSAAGMAFHCSRDAQRISRVPSSVSGSQSRSRPRNPSCLVSQGSQLPSSALCHTLRASAGTLMRRCSTTAASDADRAAIVAKVLEGKAVDEKAVDENVEDGKAVRAKAAGTNQSKAAISQLTIGSTLFMPLAVERRPGRRCPLPDLRPPAFHWWWLSLPPARVRCRCGRQSPIALLRCGA